MSSAYYTQPTPIYPTAQQPVNYAYYQTAYDGQAPYVRTPDAAIRERSLVPAAPTSALGSWFDYTNSSYIKGLLLGVGVTLLVTSPPVQNAVIKGTVAAWSAVVGGIEEVKERVRDAKAEKSMAES
ncbi:YtxH domain-containing protein [Desulfosarcina ovata]|uniref:YtxH domain-containing protein n=1 Tax=Desulfosarcina ovata subsp. ovata TaxID=2752305 RepID=A0A5K8ADA8_9BACT|nr:YtxH domain-containing protein [Desulfosarcina ovata]BBO90529.1 hypothetical protein DSCOOX_37090 [Desulfosarcina ovata subsp. ovata]